MPEKPLREHWGAMEDLETGEVPVGMLSICVDGSLGIYFDHAFTGTLDGAKVERIISALRSYFTDEAHIHTGG